MVITQKVTSLAFNLHDGLSRKPEELSDLQKHQAVKSVEIKIDTKWKYESINFEIRW